MSFLRKSSYLTVIIATFLVSGQIAMAQDEGEEVAAEEDTSSSVENLTIASTSVESVYPTRQPSKGKAEWQFVVHLKQPKVTKVVKSTDELQSRLQEKMWQAFAADQCALEAVMPREDKTCPDGYLRETVDVLHSVELPSNKKCEGCAEKCEGCVKGLPVRELNKVAVCIYGVRYFEAATLEHDVDNGTYELGSPIYRRVTAEVIQDKVVPSKPGDKEASPNQGYTLSDAITDYCHLEATAEEFQNRHVLIINTPEKREGETVVAPAGSASSVPELYSLWEAFRVAFTDDKSDKLVEAPNFAKPASKNPYLKKLNNWLVTEKGVLRLVK